jgi:hypothetical protein
LIRQARGIREKRPFGLRIGRNLHVAHLVGEPAVRRVNFDRRGLDRRESPGKGARQRGLESERGPVVDHDVRESRDGLLAVRGERLDT